MVALAKINNFILLAFARLRKENKIIIYVILFLEKSHQRKGINMKNIVLSGDRPTGKLHLGHYVGSLQNRLALQAENREIKILIADTQVLNNNVEKSQNVRKNTLELMRAYYAIGLTNVQFILQSEIPYIFELGSYLTNLTTSAQVLRNPTLNAEAKMYGNALNLGFINYPVMQTADILIFNGYDVPVGADQLPVLEYGNDLISKFNNAFKCNIFKKINPILSTSSRLVGVDGKNKMSKSLGNVISLNATNEEITKQVKSMYTDPNHIKVTDPGKVEGNVVFSYLDIFHSNKEEVEALKEHYRRGGLGDMYLKKMLINDLENLILPIREKYNSFSDKELLERLNSDTEEAFIEAKNNMKKIKSFIFK